LDGIVNLGESFQWISEDTIELYLGEPVAHETLVCVEKISQWIHVTRPEWLIDYCYGFGVFSLVVRPEQIDTPFLIDELTVILDRSASDIDFEDSQMIEIPVCYSPDFGLDLQSISEATNVSVDAIIDLHCGRDYRVLATGFVPGFAYLGETDHAIHLPRRDTPRTRIPAGSVAIAENQTVVYPRETPGGWHIIGRMPGSIVSLSKDAINAKLEMGRLVRFKSISMDEFLAIEAADDPG
jgi:inhibitor of KinA